MCYWYVADSEEASALQARAQERRERDLAVLERRLPAVAAALRAGARAGGPVAVRHVYAFARVLIGAATTSRALNHAAGAAIATAFEDLAPGVKTCTFKDDFVAASKREWTVPAFVQERLSVVGQSWDAADRELDARWCEQLDEEADESEDDGAEADDADDGGEDPDIGDAS